MDRNLRTIYYKRVKSKVPNLSKGTSHMEKVGGYNGRITWRKKTHNNVR